MGPCRQNKKEELTVNKTDKQAEIREKVLPACTPARTNNRRDLSPLFVCMIIPPPLSLHSSPNRFSYPLALSLLSFCLPSPTPPRFCAFFSFSCSSLQYTVPGGNSSKSNCLSISHQYTASRGLLPPQNNESRPEH